MALRQGLILIGVLSTALVARGNLVFNGDFESDPTIFTGWTTTSVTIGSNTFNWIVEHNFSPTSTTAPGINQSQSGIRFADPACSGAGCMDTSTGMYLYQDLATVVGQSYTLTFWLDLGPCKLSTDLACPTGSLAEQFQAWFGAPTAVPGAGHGALGSPVFDTGVFNNNTSLDPGWTLETFQVTATSTTTRLEFIGRDDPLRIGLDNVSVDPVVPEPSTMLLFGIGLVSLAAIARRLNLALATK